MEIPPEPDADPFSADFMGHTCGDEQNPLPCTYEFTKTKLASYHGQEQIEVSFPNGDTLKAQIHDGKVFYVKEVKGEEAGIHLPSQPIPIPTHKVKTFEDEAMDSMPSADEMEDFAKEHQVR